MSAPDNGLPWWQPWAALSLFALPLNFPWELLQAPLYAEMAEAPHWAVVLDCGRATLGDIAITLVAYAAVMVRRRGRGWIQAPSGLDVAAYVAIGLLLTAAIEALSVYWWRRWSYSSAMPLLAGVGVAPLAQWTVLPPIGLWLARRHLASCRRPAPDAPPVP